MTPVFGHGRLRLYLLKLLDESPRHGYDVIRELEDRFLGLYSPSAGTVYPRLARLTADGLVTQTEADGRKVYTITDAGRSELAARRGELDDLEADIAGSVRDLADEIRSDVKGSVRDLKAELKAAARDVRRMQRHAGRSQSVSAQPAATAPTAVWVETGRGGAGARPADGDEPGVWLRFQLDALTATLGRWSLSDRQRAELRTVLTKAADDVVRIVRDGRPPQD